MTDTLKTICPLDCPDSCGLLATVENGKITRINGDPEHPFTKGFLCRKMRHYADRIYAEQRILVPQIRTGQKGSGQFRRISWDEAWDRLVSRLTELKGQHGGETLLPYSYAGNMGQINRWAGEAFFHRFGASRLKRTICSAAAGAAWNAHCGKRPGSPPERATEADIIVAWGINIKTTNIHFWPVIQQCRRSGGKLIVIDPYRNKTAKAADIHLPVKPGGDSALALGALKAILQDGLEDREFITSRTTGFEDLETYIKSLDWREIEMKSGISKDRICDFGQWLGRHPRSFIRIGMGMTRNTTGAMSVRSILCLAAALGLFREKAGQGVLLSSGAFSGNSEALIHTSLAETETREINMIQLGRALTRLTPPIHALLVFNANPLSIAPDASQVRRGLEREDLFTVVHEQTMTPTARYADLLLPATTSFENSDIYTAYGHFYMSVTRPVIAPVGEAISNFDLFQTLAAKMGYDESPFRERIEERIRNFISGLDGIDPELAETGIQTGALIQSTRRNSTEDAIFIFTSPDLGYDIRSFPCLAPSIEFDDPDLSSRYPLKLITPPATALLNSTFGEFYKRDIGRLLIHPVDASQSGIQDGQQVRVFNHRGSTIRRACVTGDTQPGLIVAEGIYWESEESGRTGINDLTSQKTTDMGEGSTFHESRAAIEPLTA